MTFIVGDIHGEIEKLRNLIQIILNIDKQASFIFIGDYLDKGDNPLAVIQYLQELQQSNDCVFLLGNHEHLWINYTKETVEIANYLLKYGGTATIKSLGCNNIETASQILNTEFGAFFMQLKKFHYYKGYLIVHSGISSVANNAKNLNEVDEKEFLFNRYDFLKTASLYKNQYKIVFGHTAFYSPYYDGFKIGIDTAACFLNNQPLTAFNADEAYFIDSNQSKLLLSHLSNIYLPNIVRVSSWTN